PLGLMIASGELYDAVTEAAAYAHGFTWSHHAVGAAVAGAVIDIIERERLVERSAVLGEVVHQRLTAELGEHPHVGQVRGVGLLRAVELVADRDTKAPFDRAERVSERIVAAAFER